MYVERLNGVIKRCVIKWLICRCRHIEHCCAASNTQRNAMKYVNALRVSALVWCNYLFSNSEQPKPFLRWMNKWFMMYGVSAIVEISMNRWMHAKSTKLNSAWMKSNWFGAKGATILFCIIQLNMIHVHGGSNNKKKKYMKVSIHRSSRMPVTGDGQLVMLLHTHGHYVRRSPTVTQFD